MAIRIPTTVPSSPFDRATCEHVFEALAKRGPVIDAAILADYGDHDPRRIRYARDVLGMFAGLGQVEHIRRDLWLIDPWPSPSHASGPDEFLRAHLAARAMGDWCIVTGRWALTLRGLRLRYLDETAAMRFVLTTRRARPSSYAHRGQQRALGLLDPAPALDGRHVTVIDGVPIAAATRPSDSMPNVEWLEQHGHGAHVAGIADAFISLFEYPRLSGGFSTARHAALPVLGAVGLDAVIDAGRNNPTLAVRRRLSFALFDVVVRTEGCMSFLGPDDWGEIDDQHERWRIPRALGVADRCGAPTVLDPHREATGTLHPSANVIDNRAAPVRRRAPTALTKARAGSGA